MIFLILLFILHNQNFLNIQHGSSKKQTKKTQDRQTFKSTQNKKRCASLNSNTFQTKSITG